MKVLHKIFHNYYNYHQIGHLIAHDLIASFPATLPLPNESPSRSHNCSQKGKRKFLYLLQKSENPSCLVLHCIASLCFVTFFLHPGSFPGLITVHLLRPPNSVEDLTKLVTSYEAFIHLLSFPRTPVKYYYLYGVV
jgi:hypothetical protein